MVCELNPPHDSSRPSVTTRSNGRSGRRSHAATSWSRVNGGGSPWSLNEEPAIHDRGGEATSSRTARSSQAGSAIQNMLAVDRPTRRSPVTGIAREDSCRSVGVVTTAGGR